jgi:hypothetical protein
LEIAYAAAVTVRQAKSDGWSRSLSGLRGSSMAIWVSYL